MLSVTPAPRQRKSHRRPGDHRTARPLPPPTRALPGSDAKVSVLETRAALGQQLWNPLDSGLPERYGFDGEQAGGDNLFLKGLFRQGSDGELELVERKRQHTGRHRTEQEKFKAMMELERERLRKREERRRKKAAAEGVTA